MTTSPRAKRIVTNSAIASPSPGGRRCWTRDGAATGTSSGSFTMTSWGSDRRGGQSVSSAAMVERTQPPTTSSAGAQGGSLAGYLEETELAELIRSFGRLPEVVRTGIVTIVAAAIFLLTTSEERTDFDYFVRLADAFL